MTWYSVKENPIPNNRPVLQLRLGSLNSNGNVVRPEFEGNGYSTVTAYSIGNNKNWATHWMELPEPPK